MDFTENKKNYYESKFEQYLDSGLLISEAVHDISHIYLDGKPKGTKKNKITRAIQDEWFWSCSFLYSLSTSEFELEAFVQALARYMGQEKTTNIKLINKIASEAPEVVRRAIRYSGLILRKDSKRWREIKLLATTEKSEFQDFISICNIFQYTHLEHKLKLEKQLEEISRV